VTIEVKGPASSLPFISDSPVTQSRFVKTAIETLVHEGGVGLFLTCLMILIFLPETKDQPLPE